MSIEDIVSARVASWREDQVARWDASVPDALQGYNLDSLIESKWSGNLSNVQMKKFQSYLENPTKFLVLYGPSGLGKTVMGVEVCKKFLEDSTVNNALYVGAPQVLSELSYSFEGVNPITKYSTPDILLLDDIGASTTSITDVRKNGLWAIIDNRWSQGKLTILSTNLSPVKTGDNELEITLQDYMGESSWDRVLSSYTLITFTGTSLRKKNSTRTSNRRRQKGKQD